MKKITVTQSLIEGRERLKLHFEYDKEIIDLIRMIPGAHWYPAERCWHVSVLAGIDVLCATAKEGEAPAGGVE